MPAKGLVLPEVFLAAAVHFVDVGGDLLQVADALLYAAHGLFALYAGGNKVIVFFHQIRGDLLDHVVLGGAVLRAGKAPCDQFPKLFVHGVSSF